MILSPRKLAAFTIVALAFHGVLIAGEAKPTGAPLKVFMVSGCKEYASEPSLTAFKAYLEKHYQVACTLSAGKDGGKELPHIEALDQSDVLIVFCRRMQLAKDQLERIQRWCKAGKPVIGLRTASHAFQTWLAFDKEVLGGDYKGHGGDEKAVRVTVEAKAKAQKHPILEGVTEWTRPGRLYRNPNLAKDATVLLRGTGQKDTQPLAWARVYDKAKDGRSFYTSMGLPDDFQNDNFRKLLVNAISWTAKRKLEAVAGSQ